MDKMNSIIWFFVLSHIKNYKNYLLFILNKTKPLKLYLLYLEVVQ